LQDHSRPRKTAALRVLGPFVLRRSQTDEWTEGVETRLLLGRSQADKWTEGVETRLLLLRSQTDEWTEGVDRSVGVNTG
jgi:hypothetical protein